MNNDDFVKEMQSLRDLQDKIFYKKNDILHKCGWLYSTPTGIENITAAVYTKSVKDKIFVAYSQSDALNIECQLRKPKPEIKF